MRDDAILPRHGVLTDSLRLQALEKKLMRIGVTFPQTEIGGDASGVKDYAQTVEALGFTHILAYDHVLGADLTNRPEWNGPYNLDSNFHEPFVMYGFLAGLTNTIELTTGIIIAPQRQTVLLAKQAAALDVLSGGRLRLGIGLGWNEVEYEALNEEFSNRGSRVEEQIEVLRRLWTQKSVDFQGKWHTISQAGLNPMPLQQPIPLWMGGGATERVQRRIARLADGWMPQLSTNEKGRETLETFKGYLRDYGRDLGQFGIDCGVRLENNKMDEAAARVETLRNFGATHISVSTMGQGLKGADAHLQQLEKFRVAVPS
jgi:probable F420-dependent oxidoreductase